MAPADATCFSNPRSSMLLGSMVPHQVVDPALEPCPVMAVQKKKLKVLKGARVPLSVSDIELHLQHHVSYMGLGSDAVMPC